MKLLLSILILAASCSLSIIIFGYAALSQLDALYLWALIPAPLVLGSWLVLRIWLPSKHKIN